MTKRPPPIKSHAMPSALCLRCGYHVDAAMEMTGVAKPKPGDITVCLNCGGLSMFAMREHRLVLEPASEAVIDTLGADKVRLIRQSQRYIERRGPIMHQKFRT